MTETEVRFKYSAVTYSESTVPLVDSILTFTETAVKSKDTAIAHSGNAVSLGDSVVTESEVRLRDRAVTLTESEQYTRVQIKNIDIQPLRTSKM